MVGGRDGLWDDLTSNSGSTYTVKIATLPFNKLARCLEVGRKYLCGGNRVEGAHTQSELGPPLAA